MTRGRRVEILRAWIDAGAGAKKGSAPWRQVERYKTELAELEKTGDYDRDYNPVEGWAK